MSQHTDRAEAIFYAALEKASSEERSAYLEDACAGNVELRQRVETLLADHARAGSFLDRPAVEWVASDVTSAAMASSSSLGEPTQALKATDGEPPVSQPASATQADTRLDDKHREALAFLELSTKAGSLGRLDHYEIQEIIGKGGFGTVFKAFDEKLHRVVAIKLLAPELAVSGTAKARFLREARAAAAVRHEHVVDIHAVDDDPIPYLVMEYVEGQTLQEKLDKSGPLEVKEILRIGYQTACGLAAAHKQGLIHRDIKPGNILLENGVERVKLTDFGLARAMDDASVTQSGVVAGTPMYMSPEQAEGLTLDHRSDLFSLGTVLYVTCTGRPPFRASGTMAILKRVCEDSPRPIREINSEIPQWLCDIVDKLHAKKPEDRFTSAKEVADVLARYLAEIQTHGQVFASLPHVVAGSPPVVAGSPDPATRPTGGLLNAESRGDLRSSQWPGRETGPQRETSPQRETPWWTYAGALLLVATAIFTLVVTFVPEVRQPMLGSVVLSPRLGVSLATMLAALGIGLWTGRRQIARSSWSQLGKGALPVLGIPLLFFLPVFLFIWISRLMQPMPDGKSEIKKLASEISPPSLAVAPFNANNAKEHQEAWAKHLGVPVEISNSIGMKLRLIPPGEFLMGSTDEQLKTILENTSDYGKRLAQAENPPRRQRIADSFYLGTMEVTVGQFRQFVKDTGYKTGAETSGEGGFAVDDEATMGPYKGIQRPEHTWQNPLFALADDHPVVLVGTADAEAFCRWLSDKDGRTYRLPSEVEFEYACRAGTTTLWYTGDDPVRHNIAEWASQGGGRKLHPGGGKAANPFGLFDMLGNVQELCLRLPSGEAVVRGSHVRTGPWLGRSASRYTFIEQAPFSQRGFRVALVGDLKAKAPSPAIAPFSAAKAKQYQNDWAKHLGVEPEITNSIGMKLRLIPPGKNSLESSKKAGSGEPFFIGAHEVTVGQFRQFVEESKHKTAAETNKLGGIRVYPGKKGQRDAKHIWSHPEIAPTADHPVSLVTWQDARAFCEWLSRKDGRTYRLPTDAEWRWASHGGSDKPFYFGDNVADLDAHAWHWSNATSAKAVGLKQGNPWGLFDMYGNVWELTHNWQRDGKFITPTAPGEGPVVTDRLNFLGGSFNDQPESTIEPGHGPPLVAHSHVGFRVALVGELQAKTPAAAPGSILGRITHRGIPIWAGTVTFHFADKRSFSAKIQADGTYSVELPEKVVGPAKVAVDVPPPPPGARLLKKVSARYLDPEKSGLSVTVVSGKQELNIELDEVDLSPPLAVAPFDAAKAKEHQDAWAKHLGVPVEITNSIGMKLRLIPPGEFTMGSDAKEIDWLLTHAPELNDAPDFMKAYVRGEGPQRRVTIREPFRIGAHEVLVGHFREFVNATKYQTEAETSGGGFVWNNGARKWERDPAHVWNNPKYAGSETHPVVFVTPADARAFCAWLSEREGFLYALPNETQWEYACRAGTATRWYFGDDDAAMKKHGWTGPHAGGKRQPAGRLTANPFGLFDVHGNVTEFAVTPQDAVFERGGQSNESSYRARSAWRSPITKVEETHERRGFRVAIVGDLKAKTPLGKVEPWVPLFNGKDLTGWKVFEEQPDNWKVEDGILVGRGPSSHLLSDHVAKKGFHLRAEARINDGGVGSIMVHAGNEATFASGRPFGAAAMINSTGQHSHKTGSLYAVYPGWTNAPAGKNPPPKADKWFTLEIISQHDWLVEAKINGDLSSAVQADGWIQSYPRIALQVAGDKSVIQFRKIEIKELPP